MPFLALFSGGLHVRVTLFGWTISAVMLVGGPDGAAKKGIIAHFLE